MKRFRTISAVTASHVAYYEFLNNEAGYTAKGAPKHLTSFRTRDNWMDGQALLIGWMDRPSRSGGWTGPLDWVDGQALSIGWMDRPSRSGGRAGPLDRVDGQALLIGWTDRLS